MTSNKLLLILAILPAFAAPQPPDLKLFESVEPHMGTLFRIKVYANNQQSAESAFHAAFARISELDNILSDYKPDSELSTSTRVPGFHAGSDLAVIIEASQRLSEQTGGAFDITVGPLSQLWRKARKESRQPDPAAISSARDRCGYRMLHLSEATHLITTERPDMQLDAGGIAKGYAADEALAVISKLGMRSALVAASGDLAFSDAPPGQSGWKIGVDSLDAADKPFTRILLLHNAAVSTSGDTEQFLQSNGQTYSHIINPNTGMGLTTHIAVTTIAPTGLLADPAATAVSVLGCEPGLAFVESQPYLAAFILEREQGATHIAESLRFKALLKEQRADN